MSSRHGDASSREAEPKTAAIRFFRDPDLCTLFCQVLIESGRTNRAPSSRPCVSTAYTNSLLAFRGVTREAWNAVMLEQRTRSALSLVPQDEAVEGVLVYSNPNEFTELRGPPYNRPDLAYPFLSHNPDDAAAFRALQIADPTCKEWNQRGPRSCVVTHHRAAHHQHGYYSPYRGSDFWILLEDYELCAALPLAREMFLTQPPQKSIRFGLRYQYKPSVGNHFWIHNEDGVRFGDVVAYFETAPELLEQVLEPGHPMYWARRWLSSSEVVRLDRIVWTHVRAVVKGSCIEDHARSNTAERERGGAGFENCNTWRR